MRRHVFRPMPTTSGPRGGGPIMEPQDGHDLSEVAHHLRLATDEDAAVRGHMRPRRGRPATLGSRVGTRRHPTRHAVRQERVKQKPPIPDRVTPRFLP